MFFVRCLILALFSVNTTHGQDSIAAVGADDGDEITEPFLIRNTSLINVGREGCVDINLSCSMWSRRGECDSNPAYMYVNCPVTCDSCLPNGGEECKDRVDKNSCFLASLLGECQANPSYTHRFCAESCRDYISSCRNSVTPAFESATNCISQSLRNPDFSCGIAPSNLSNTRIQKRTIELPSVSKNAGEDILKTLERLVKGSINLRKNKGTASLSHPTSTHTQSVVQSRQSSSNLATSTTDFSTFVSYYVNYYSSSIASSSATPIALFSLLAMAATAIAVGIAVPLGVAIPLGITAVNQPPIQPPSFQQPPQQFQQQQPCQAQMCFDPAPRTEDAQQALIPNCDPTEYLWLNNFLNSLIGVNSGRPLDPKVFEVVKAMKYCRYGAAEPPPMLAVPFDRPGGPADLEPPPRWPGFSYPSLFLYENETDFSNDSIVLGKNMTTRPPFSLTPPEAIQIVSAPDLATTPSPSVVSSSLSDQKPPTILSITLTDIASIGLGIAPGSVSGIPGSLTTPFPGFLSETPSIPDLDDVTPSPTTTAGVSSITDTITTTASTTTTSRPRGPRPVTGDNERDKFFCGGALLTNRHILTAGHCIVGDEKPNLIRLGERDFLRLDESEAFDFSLESITVFPGYDFRYNYNDITLMTLKESVEFSQDITPYCVPQSQLSLEGLSCLVSGWGSRPNAEASTVLTSFPVTVIPQSRCRTTYEAAGPVYAALYPNGFPSTAFCAGGRPGEDACRGDSGGPLIYKPQELQFGVGLVSAGNGCGDPNFPGIYTRVDAFIDWIDVSIYGRCSASNFGTSNLV